MDRDAPYTRGRETVCLGEARAQDSYLSATRVVQAAKQSRCSALHPGWGFLAENAQFASLCKAHGIEFIGPPSHVIGLMGSKTKAKANMGEAGIASIPGSDGPVATASQAQAVAEMIGYPVLVKAESGGGGRGMRAVSGPDEMAGAFATAASEAKAAFGDPTLYIEKLISDGRHIEVQVLADLYGNVVHLGERDCSIQRNHQKLIEESPSPVLSSETRQRVTNAAVIATRHVGYVGAGTVEFLVDGAGNVWFMEMNTRLQVEHPVSELRSGIDLVTWQLRVAAGQSLDFCQDDVTLSGHTIECRINAEDPYQDFRAQAGTIAKWNIPAASDNIRIDTHVEAGYVVPPHYDSLLCKVITRGDTRKQASDRMLTVLDQFVCEGVPTTIPLHVAVLSSTAFHNHGYNTRVIPGWTPYVTAETESPKEDKD